MASYSSSSPCSSISANPFRQTISLLSLLNYHQLMPARIIIHTPGRLCWPGPYFSQISPTEPKVWAIIWAGGHLALQIRIQQLLTALTAAPNMDGSFGVGVPGAGDMLQLQVGFLLLLPYLWQSQLRERVHTHSTLEVTLAAWHHVNVGARAAENPWATSIYLAGACGLDPIS